MRKGKLIVIDGIDGSGKATQTALLVKKLKKHGYKVKVEDFPRYGKKSAGPVEDYLNGLYGSAQELGPFIPSVFYAIDRFAASPEIRLELQNGFIVISNRYVTANMAHQGGKIASSKARDKYFKWVLDLEYNLFKIPKPDLTIILHMPARIAQKLVDNKKYRRYINGKKRDLHEADLQHLRAAERTYLEIAEQFGYTVIECFQQGKNLTRQEIAKLIWRIVAETFRFPEMEV